MLIQQIIEFELRGLGPLGRASTSKLFIFLIKQKSLKEDRGVDYYLLLKYCRGQCILLLQNLTLKCKILNLFCT